MRLLRIVGLGPPDGYVHFTLLAVPNVGRYLGGLSGALLLPPASVELRLVSITHDPRAVRARACTINTAGHGVGQPAHMHLVILACLIALRSTDPDTAGVSSHFDLVSMRKRDSHMGGLLSGKNPPFLTSSQVHSGILGKVPYNPIRPCPNLTARWTLIAVTLP